jgi:lipopolysaccharide export system protein LptA
LRYYLAPTLLILAILLSLASAPVQAAPPVPGAPPGKGTPAPAAPPGEFPLHITAAKMEADQNAGVVIFSGQVKATYGESTLYSDTLRVFFQPKPAEAKGKAPAPGAPEAAAAQETPGKSPLEGLGGNKIDRIVAQGQVRFVKEDQVATGQTATYYKERDEVVLVGNPQMWQGENNLKGERIIFNLKNNKMLVESSPQKRVDAHLYPSNKGAAGQGASLLPAKIQKGRKP